MNNQSSEVVKGPITKPEDFSAPCGCKVRFDNDGLVRLEQCPLHGMAAELLEALKFYADPKNWNEIETGIGMQDGPAIDYGATARAAISRATQP